MRICPSRSALGSLLVFALSIASCERSDSGGDPWIVTDSTDLRRIGYRGSTPPGEVLSSKSLMARLSDPPGGLGEATAGAIGSDSRFLLDAQAGHIIRYDTAGRFLGTIGRIGDGPGEFRRPASLTVLGDTVYVLDRRRARVVRYLEDGTFLGELPTGPLPLLAAPFSGGQGVAVLSLDLGRPRTQETGRATIFRSSVLLSRVDEQGSRELMREEGPDEVMLGSASLPTPFGSRPALVHHPDGVVLGGGARHHLYLIGPDGVHGVFDWLSFREPIDDREWDSLRTSLLADARPGSGDMIEGMFIEAARPEHKPWVGRVAVDQTLGTIWIQNRGAFAADTETVTGIDLQQRTVRQITLPVGSALLAVGSGQMMLRRTDPLGVHRIEMYNLGGSR